MTRPTLQYCKDQLAAFAASEHPEDCTTSLDPIRVGNATLTVLTIFWEARGANTVPREARLTFGLDQRLLFVQVLNPGMFMHALEEGFDTTQADAVATYKLAGLEEVWRYLKAEPYCLAD